MLPEVENYVSVLYTENEKYKTEYTKIRQDLYYDDRGAFVETDEKLTSDRDNAIDTAWNALGKSENAMVRFIVENCQPYRDDQAKYALMLLPCSGDIIVQYAKDHGWCDTFDTLFEKAIVSGVIDGVVYSKEEIELRTYLRKKGRLTTQALNKVVEMARALAFSEAVKNDAVETTE